MPDIKTPNRNDLTNRCFHCGSEFRDWKDLDKHLDIHRKTDKGLRKIETK